MKKLGLGVFLCGLICCVGALDVWAADEAGYENDSVEDRGDEKQKVYLNNLQEREQLRRAEIEKERANEKSRFKLKAIENTKKREERYQEIMDRKKENASRFQKKAWEKAERKKEEEARKKEEKEKNKSRFRKKAEERAAERALKRKLKESRLKRNK